MADNDHELNRAIKDFIRENAMKITRPAPMTYKIDYFQFTFSTTKYKEYDISSFVNALDLFMTCSEETAKSII